MLHAKREGAEEVGDHVDGHLRVAVIVHVGLEAGARRPRGNDVEPLDAERRGAEGDRAKGDRAEPAGYLRVDERLHVPLERRLDKGADKGPQLRDNLVHPLGRLDRVLVAGIDAGGGKHLRSGGRVDGRHGAGCGRGEGREGGEGGEMEEAPSSLGGSTRAAAGGGSRQGDG